VNKFDLVPSAPEQIDIAENSAPGVCAHAGPGESLGVKSGPFGVVESSHSARAAMKMTDFRGKHDIARVRYIVPRAGKVSGSHR
jgi:hypothetical protein